MPAKQIEVSKKTIYEVEIDGKKRTTQDHAEAERMLAEVGLRDLLAGEGPDEISESNFKHFMKALFSAMNMQVEAKLLLLMHAYLNPWRCGYGSNNESSMDYPSVYRFYDMAPIESNRRGKEWDGHMRGFQLMREDGGSNIYPDTKWRRNIDLFANPPATEYVKDPPVQIKEEAD